MGLSDSELVYHGQEQGYLACYYPTKVSYGTLLASIGFVCKSSISSGTASVERQDMARELTLGLTDSGPCI